MKTIEISDRRYAAFNAMFEQDLQIFYFFVNTLPLWECTGRNPLPIICETMTMKRILRLMTDLFPLDELIERSFEKIYIRYIASNFWHCIGAYKMKIH